MRAGCFFQKNRMVQIAAAENMTDALKSFKSPDARAANALVSSTSKYATAFKGVAIVGWGATLVEEGSYVMNTHNTNPDKTWHAAAASVTNVAGDMSAIYGGMKFGAWIGAYAAPYTFGLSIPLGAVAGGVIGHFAYDGLIKPEVRQGWTGVTQDDQ